MTNNVLDEWMYSTILIRNQEGRLGTGFAVMRTFDNDTKRSKSLRFQKNK